MKQGIKKFTNATQGGRAAEGKKEGETFLATILKTLGLTTEKIKFTPRSDKVKLRMTPDFVVKAPGKKNEYLILESKYKQISGSDWEKLESNWGFHTYYYNELCGVKSKIIVILSGYWRDKQKNLYPTFFDYIKNNYGKDCIFDFSDSVDEIYRFAEFMGIKLNVYLKGALIAHWAYHKKIPEVMTPEKK